MRVDNGALTEWRPELRLRRWFSQKKAEGPERPDRDKFKGHHSCLTQGQLFEQPVRFGRVGYVHQKYRARAIRFGEPLVDFAR
jgi:hypothetical protein